MNYTASKVFTVIFCSIFILVGSGLLLVFLAADKFIFVPSVVGLMFVLMGGAMMRQKLKEISKFQKTTYAWYKTKNPAHVNGNGVMCFSCDSPRTQVRALMKQTYHREHFCADCGQTLYYSPEQNA